MRTIRLSRDQASLVMTMTGDRIKATTAAIREASENGNQAYAEECRAWLTALWEVFNAVDGAPEEDEQG